MIEVGEEDEGVESGATGNMPKEQRIRVAEVAECMCDPVVGNEAEHSL